MPSVVKLVAQVAVPADTVAGFPPVHVKFVPPSANVTVPAPTMVPEWAVSVTVAVKVTELLGLVVYDGFSDEVTLVDVASPLDTVKFRHQLPMLAVSPPMRSTAKSCQVPLGEIPPNCPINVSAPCGPADVKVDGAGSETITLLQPAEFEQYTVASPDVIEVGL